MDLEKTKILTQGLCQSILIVEPYFEKIHERGRGILSPTPRELTFIGMIFRVCCLVKTLKKLDEPNCFQSILSANRTLLELAVDSILLFRNEPKDAVRRMLAWESSAKVKRAEGILGFYKSKADAVPDHYRVLEEQVKLHKDPVNAERHALGWVSKKGTPIHPQRWTNRNLRQDARKADEFVRTKLEEIYVTEHSMLCWHVHSGLAGVRGVTGSGIGEETFYALVGLAAESCCNLAFICARYFLLLFKFTEILDVPSEFGEIDRRMDEAQKVAVLRLMELEQERKSTTSPPLSPSP